MKKLLLEWALVYITRFMVQNPKFVVQSQYNGRKYILDLLPLNETLLQDAFYDDGSTASPVMAEPEPERAGRVVEVSNATPAWKPDQHGGVIVAEPTLVANERKLKERK